MNDHTKNKLPPTKIIFFETILSLTPRDETTQKVRILVVKILTTEL